MALFMSPEFGFQLTLEIDFHSFTDGISESHRAALCNIRKANLKSCIALIFQLIFTYAKE
jgi:hypothetical protein